MAKSILQSPQSPAYNKRRRQNRQRYMDKGRGRAAAPRDRESGLLPNRRREGEPIPNGRGIAYATSPATSRGQIQAIDKSQNRRGPIGRFVATARAKRTAQKIPRHIQLTKIPMALCGAQSRRAAERLHRIGSTWRNTTRRR